jgi:demethylmenaquinone methyltransferase/2-methoxy-6-polyprenyl-1,4-benzoquinol methylase
MTFEDDSMTTGRNSAKQAHGNSPKSLRKMFSAIPRRYDLLNRLLTAGFDKRWRRLAALECIRETSGYALDLCCGTGDLALHLAAMSGSGLEVVGLDFSGPMLEEARRKARAAGLSDAVGLVHGDVADLPFPDDHFSVVGISFAFRNLTFRNRSRSTYLAEVRRVLSPGGRFVIVETSQPSQPMLRTAAHLYYRLVVSRIGGYVSGHAGAYRYLAASARRFYASEEVSDLLLDTGFRKVDVRLLFGGVAALHVAVK